ncbi:MAG: pentapeptide repeat-containing protein [Phycisphaerales bacterium]|nr:pentapeptide repeat-containing protein [Phycisphaerales bacterium]
MSQTIPSPEAAFDALSDPAWEERQFEVQVSGDTPPIARVCRVPKQGNPIYDHLGSRRFKIKNLIVTGSGEPNLESGAEGADIESTVLLNETLQAAAFRDVVFRRCTIIGVNFEHCSFDRVKFIECYLYNCKFTACEVRDVIFRDHVVVDCLLSNISFESSRLTSVRFRNSDLSKVDLRRADATDVVIDRDCATQGMLLAAYQMDTLVHLQNPAACKDMEIDRNIRPTSAVQYRLARRTIALLRYKLGPAEFSQIALSSLGFGAAVGMLLHVLFAVAEGKTGPDESWPPVGWAAAAAAISFGVQLIAYSREINLRRRSLQAARVLGLRRSTYSC